MAIIVNLLQKEKKSTLNINNNVSHYIIKCLVLATQMQTHDNSFKIEKKKKLKRKSFISPFFSDTRETGFVNAITAAGVTYAVTKACTLGNLIECSCDKSHSRRNGGQPQMVNAVTAVAALERQQAAYEKNTTRQRNNRRHNGNNNRNNNNNNNSGKRGGNWRRRLLKNIKFPEGEWEWGGCSDNVNFGFRHSRIFLDSKYRRRSDLRTLVKLHNNMAGRLVRSMLI